MELQLPSMVQRSGDTLIVRSVVSGNQLYMDQGVNNNNGPPSNSASAHNQQQQQQQQIHHNNASTSALEQQFERYRAAAVAQAQQQHYLQQQQQQQQNAVQHQAAAAAALELKDEGLPQCKIKRNYSCSYCTYFTQNPRYHLTHLRDVHGEKIVINKCKLCLYASRHFQKLVRHMKMVHGCTDGIAGGHGQARGKRGMSREARKRKLEQSVGASLSGPSPVNVGTVGVAEMPTLEQVQRELELQGQKLQRDLQAFNKQQEEQKHQQQQLASNAAEAIFAAAAYERQIQAQRDRDLEARQARNVYEQDALAAEVRRQSPINNASNSGFQMPAHHHHISHSRNLELTPSPNSSAASPSGTAAGTPPATHTSSNNNNNNNNTTSVALSLTSYAEEPAQNRLLKCSLCDFTTLYRAQLLDHELDEHCKTKFFRCEKCSYVTHIKARFSKHVKYHSMPMIKCVTCDFRTPYKWNLDRHMKNHGGAGPFKCAACDFTADIKQSLTVHEMNHHVPPVGHAAGMSLARRRNKVGGTDLLCGDDFLSDSAEMLEDHYNNNNLDEYDEALVVAGSSPPEVYGKKCKYEEDEPTDLSQKGGSSDTSSVHNHAVNTLTPKAKRPVPNLIPIPKGGSNVLNLSKDLAASRSSLTDIASMFFNEKQLNEMLRPLDKSDAAQLSPTTTIASASSHNSRSLLQRRSAPGGSFFDKLKSSALTSGGPSENLICPCGHMAKCLSESIIHRKTCTSSAIAVDDDDIEEEEEHDDADGRLEIDFVDEDDKQSHSALNLSVTGSTRCQHCRHRCKSSADLLNHLKLCTEAGRCGNESYDSMMSGESSGGGRGGGGGTDSAGEHQHPMENRVFIWNKMPRSGGGGTGAGDGGSQCSEGQPGDSSGGNGNASNEENSYYGVETAPGYGEVTKKMTPEEEAANSSLKKVYKCPHCSFWASTASRFHVHIVGHLNKKPFECSLCSYRSNWRWDITKHIRLKTIRDPSHKSARVLMNDETGRRNYTKYNKYITLMKVTEEDGDPKLMKSGEMTPNQVASLAFLNDFNKSVSSSSHMNGSKEDITLERVGTAKSSASGEVGENQQLSDVIRLPLLATMMNAAMAQQKEQHEQQQQHTTLITPSVTISAVKRSPPPLMKPSDDVVTDYKQEGNEKHTFYKCKKCSFRHVNRDAVLAHVKIHYQDANYPIVTATMTSSPKTSASQQQQQQQQHSTPLQVAVNSSMKLIAAMCLSQQQQQQQQNQQNSNSPSKQQQHSLLLNASPLSGLALALAGKSPTKTTASILEHGEQKASQNEASAQPLTSPSIAASSSSHNSVVGLGGVTGGGGTHPAPPSLQHLLTSPRGTYSAHHSHTHNQQNSPTIVGAGGSHNNCKNNNNNLVMGLGAAAMAAFNSPTTTTQQQHTLLLQHHHQQQQQISQSPTDSPTSTIVTTLPTTPTSTATKNNNNNNNCNHLQMGLIGASSSSSSGGGQHIAADSVCIGGVLYGSNNSTLTCNITTTTSTPPTTTTTSTSCNLLLSSVANPNANATPAAAAAAHLSPSQSSSAPTFNNNTNNNNLLANDSERRDPSPYRCGHCHQVSNWKHVIQRHCRLKHAGDIRIETLDRSAINDRNAVPTYRPLGNGASNETNNFGINLKQLQQQQQQQQQPNLNNNSVLMNKNDHLLHSPLGGSAAAAAANAASTPQDLQAAAAAYLAYKVATGGNGGVGSASNEDLLQLQQNDQIEITRLPAGAASNLAQLLESSGAVLATANAQQQQQQQNSKCKQQKCPLCPYISESKSQMNYHISLHKPTQYECTKCTFVCAKKQHLSNHMRSVHHQHINSSTGASVGGGLNLDFSVALQLAAAAQAQQDSSAALSAAHAIDLTGLKSTHSNAQPQSAQHLPPEYQFKMISYCSKCPARYAQKHNEAHNANTSAKQELAEHLKCHASSHHHSASSSNTFKCEFCDFRAAHETLIQTHRYVHTQHYQEKFNELYRNCKEDVHNAAPKLMQITSTKNLQAPETVWVVDTELMAEQTKQQQQQSSSISSSTNANFDNANSLLKKQLESGPAPIPPTTALGRNTPSPTHKQPQDDDSNTPSTSASVATSDLAADLAASSGAESVASPAPLEKCQHCPYETTNTSLYKTHLQHHICVSNHKEAFTCEHCDYTDHEQQLIEEHTRIHFNAMEKLKSVAFFTSYDNLELSVERPVATMEDDQPAPPPPPAKEENEELPINHLNIKQEHNNNNEENAVNENTRELQEEKTNDVDDEEEGQEEVSRNQTPVETSEPLRKPCNKIILYKNDGCLAIKKDPSLSPAAVSGGGSDNISDRLRRRISNSRSSISHHMNGHHSETHEQHYQQQQTQQQSHKTILVNAKTGQVISRN